MLEPGEIVGGQPADEGCGGQCDVAPQAGEVLGRPLGQAEIGIGARPIGCPQPLVQHQRPEPGMAAAVGQMQIAGAQCVPDRQRERCFPDRTPQPAAVVPQELAPAGGDKVGRRILGQDLDLASIEAAGQIDRPQQPALPGVGDERQGQEGRQGFAQIRVAGEDGIDHTTAVMDRGRPAGDDGGAQAVGADAVAQAGHGFLVVAGEHRLAGVDQRQQPVLSGPTQALGLGVGGVPGAAHQAGHVRVVGLDQVVEQPLAPVEQKADEQAVPLIGRKAA